MARKQKIKKTKKAKKVVKKKKRVKSKKPRVKKRKVVKGRKKAVKTRKKTRPARRKNRKSSKRAPSESFNELHRTKIRVVGIGGGGGSIVSEIASQIPKVSFTVANTDRQALKGTSKAVKVFQFGQSLTHGLGCGMDSKLGQTAAKNEKDKIAKILKETDLCVFVSTLGGGTGSGAAPEFSRIAKDLGIMTFGIFTLPFKFEGGRRSQIARSSLEKLIPALNAISIIPNENIFQIIDKQTPIKESFSAINRRLTENLRGLCEMIYLPGLVNIDFADLKTILNGKGKLAYLNSATSQGPNRAQEVVKEVLKSPLNEYSIQGAEKIVFSITASQDLGMQEVEQISQTISEFNRRAKIIFGVSQDNSYNDKIRITILAVGCGKKEEPKKKQEVKLEPKKEVPSAPEPKIVIRKKPKPRPKPKKRKRNPPKVKTFRRARKPKKAIVVQENNDEEALEPEENKTPTRRNALDLKKVAEKTEQDLLSQENQWDIPAFLRKRESQ